MNQRQLPLSARLHTYKIFHYASSLHQMQGLVFVEDREILGDHLREGVVVFSFDVV
jgi:hypothetical protein